MNDFLSGGGFFPRSAHISKKQKQYQTKIYTNFIYASSNDVSFFNVATVQKPWLL